MKTKTTTLVTLVLVIMMLLAACGPSTPAPATTTAAPATDSQPAETEEKTPEVTDTDAPAPTGSKELGIVFGDLNNPVFSYMKEQMEAKCAELGYTAVVLDSQGSAETELNNVENLIEKGVAGICVLPVNADAALNSCKAANDAGIPIVAWNRFVDTQGQVEFATQIVTDNAPGAIELAEYSVELLKDVEDPQIAIIRGTSGVDADIDRAEPFKKALEGTALEGKVVVERNGEFARQEGYTATNDIIQAYPNISLVYALNDESAIGAYQALKEADLTDVFVLGYDGSEDYCKLIVEGEVTATQAQAFAELGTTAVERCIEKAENPELKLEPVYKIGTSLIDATNVEKFLLDTYGVKVE